MIRLLLSAGLVCVLAVSLYPREFRSFALRLRSGAQSAVISSIHAVRDLVAQDDQPAPSPRR